MKPRIPVPSWCHDGCIPVESSIHIVIIINRIYHIDRIVMSMSMQDNKK